MTDLSIQERLDQVCCRYSDYINELASIRHWRRLGPTIDPDYDIAALKLLDAGADALRMHAEELMRPLYDEADSLTGNMLVSSLLVETFVSWILAAREDENTFAEQMWRALLDKHLIMKIRRPKAQS